MDADDTVIVAQGDLGHVRGLKRKLERNGVEALLVQPPRGQGSG